MAQHSLWADDNEENKDAADAMKHSPRPQYRSLWDVPDEENIDEFDGFGGYGYTGKEYSAGAEYDARTTVDDSAEHWYGRNSFRYRRHVDYSPSKLFRTFTSRYYSYSDNEAQNKAIRALRVLTRNANTITNDNRHGTYAVQFSDGSKNNSDLELNDDKQRIVYISPDELLATTTTEDEDRVVDALTGFVMLRVQIAQTLDADIIQKFNAAALHGVGLRLAKSLYARHDSISTATDEELQKIAADSADYYMAGTLARSIAMRLARRGVIDSWGGFAAYFISHAKKFSATRETLVTAELSLETLVNQIAYNMLDDEQAIELPAFAVNVITKWLGTEVAPEALLDACQNIVIELRAQMAANGAKIVADDGVEAAIEELLQQAKKADAPKKEKSEFEKLLNGIAGTMFDGHATRNHMSEQFEQIKNNLNADKANMNHVRSLEQLLRNLKERCQSAEHVAARGNDAITRSELLQVLHEMQHAVSSRPKARKAMQTAGAEPVINKLIEQLQSTNEWALRTPEVTTAELLARLQWAVKEFTENAKSAIKAATDAIKTKIDAHREQIKKLIEQATAELPTLSSHMRTTADAVKTAHGIDPEMVPEKLERGVNNICMNGIVQLESIAKNFTALDADSAQRIAELKRTRAASGMEKTLGDLIATLDHLGSRPINDLLTDYASNYASHPIIRMLTTELTDATPKDDKTEKVEKAVAVALDARELTSNEIIAVAANEFFKPDKNHPHGLAHYSNDERHKLAQAHPGYEDTIEAIWDNLTNTAGTRDRTREGVEESCAAAREKITDVRAASTPVDDELFGKNIAVTTKILDGQSLGRANDEARNDPEEEYVAYISGGNDSTAKPIIATEAEVKRHDRANIVKTVRLKYRSFIERIRGVLQFQAGKRTEEQFGLRSGDLDEGGLYKLNYDSEHIWSRKTTSRLPDVAVGILVDQSGSMNGPKIEQARTICIILAEALRKIAGVRLYVYGHTANTSNSTNLVVFEHYTPGMGADFSRLGSIRAHANNYDGYAIKDVAKRLTADPAKKKYLFVIADGLPAGSGYAGSDAQKHVKSVCKFIRTRLKIGLYAFAVGTSSYERTNFNAQYDENHVVFVDNVMKCLPQIVRFLRNTLQKEKKLVTEHID